MTRNERDFVRLTRDALIQQCSHAGVVIVPASWRGNEFLAIAQALAQLDKLYPEPVYPYQIVYLARLTDDELTANP